MFNYLTVKTPDYATTTLSVVKGKVLPEEGGRDLRWNITDSGAREPVIGAAQTSFKVVLQCFNLTVAESNTIMDLYLDPAKGAFGTRTIKWLHPVDGHTYVVRMTDRLRRSFQIAGYRDIQTLPLLVEGYVS